MPELYHLLLILTLLLLSSACNTPIAAPKRCHRRSFAQPCQVGTFLRDLIGVREVEFGLPPDLMP